MLLRIAEVLGICAVALTVAVALIIGYACCVAGGSADDDMGIPRG